ncbi:hypothetical protein ABID25_006467 [Mesorhizobium abyssinicae]
MSISHDPNPRLKYVAQAAVKKLADSLGVDFALGVDAQLV